MLLSLFVELAENYLSAANLFGALVAADPSSVTDSRKEVFPEFLEVILALSPTAERVWFSRFALSLASK